MKRKLFLAAGLTFIAVTAFGQRALMELTFTAVDSMAYVQLDSIKIMNRTQGCDTILYWPDTILVLDFATGVPETHADGKGFQVYQNYPNPVREHTTITLNIPEKDKVNIIVTDILGRVIIQTDHVLEKGTHAFRFSPGSGNLYFFTAQWKGQVSSIKILNVTNSGHPGSLEYVGFEHLSHVLKVTEDAREFIYGQGDELLFIGYAGTLQSGIPATPEVSALYTFQFATNIPCLGTPTVEYEGQVYNTIQVFSQCWLKENLNVGLIIPGNADQTDNSVIEKYCYDNEPDSCDKYGGLYQWDEMMQYTTQQGSRGICPPGWHLPADEEWKALEGAADIQYGIGDPEWDLWGESRGYDAGANLKATSGWNSNGNGTDLYGFSGLPGGGRDINIGFFYEIGYSGFWWTSTELSSIDAWYHKLIWDGPEVERHFVFKDDVFSVRCIRDEVYIPAFELTFTGMINTTHVQLDSIKVMNQTQHCDTILYWPDTVLSLGYFPDRMDMPAAITIEPPYATAYQEMTLIFDPAEACFQSGSLAGLDSIAMHSGVSFITGETWQHIIPFDGTGANGQPPILYPTGDGRFSITFIPSEFYGLDGEIVTEICAVFNNGTNWDQDGRDFVLIGPGCMDFYIPLNTVPLFLFDPGDDLLCTGYANDLQSVIMDAPEESKTYTFQFAINIPCPGMPTVEYEGQVYTTVQIFSQCWLKENLNVGEMIGGTIEQSDNGTIEKYCFDNDPDNCDTYGGLYQWDEMMQYQKKQGVQGICPPGWHLPSDEEWTLLSDILGGQYIAGGKMKEAGYEHWMPPNTGATNESGFTALPGGISNNFFGITAHCYFWSSTEISYTNSWIRHLNWQMQSVNRYDNFTKTQGTSVRCLRDE